MKAEMKTFSQLREEIDAMDLPIQEREDILYAEMQRRAPPKVMLMISTMAVMPGTVVFSDMCGPVAGRIRSSIGLQWSDRGQIDDLRIDRSEGGVKISGSQNGNPLSRDFTITGDVDLWIEENFRIFAE